MLSAPPPPPPPHPLPPNTHTQLMRRAASQLNGKLKTVEQRVLILAGAEDQLLPSAEEAERLEKVLQRAAVRVVPEAGHSLLQEADVDLLTIIQVGTRGLQRCT